MPTYKKNDIGKLLKNVTQGKPAQVYLFVGDSFLCSKAIGQLITGLLPESKSQSHGLVVIDGEKEDQLNTLNLLKTYSLFGGRQVIKVNDSKLFHSKAVAKSIWEKAQKAFAKKDIKKAGKYLSQMAEAGGQSLGDLTDLSAAQWKGAFSFAKPQGQTNWVKEVLEQIVDQDQDASRQVKDEVADLYMAAFDAGIPVDNTLVLQAHTVDKRKKLYKFIHKQGVVLDLSVPSGSSKAARSDQESVLQELINQTLAGFGKKIEGRAIPVLLERVGFHPVAVVQEVEKLALYTGDENLITLADLEVMVGRTREDALYELTEAFSNNDLGQALLIANRLCEGGVHPLVLVSGLRNIIKKLMLVCSFKAASSPVYVEGMNFAVFQKGYLTELRASKGEWLGQLPNHPYALYMLFTKANKHSVEKLTKSMADLLQAEFRLKSSSVSPNIIFENFLWQAMS